MLFRLPVHNDRVALRRALLAAVAARRTDTLRQLVALQGAGGTARALADCSRRVADDVLSQLPPDCRDALARRLRRGPLVRLRDRLEAWTIIARA